MKELVNRVFGFEKHGFSDHSAWHSQLTTHGLNPQAFMISHPRRSVAVCEGRPLPITHSAAKRSASEYHGLEAAE